MVVQTVGRLKIEAVGVAETSVSRRRGKLVAHVVEDVVGGCSQTASVGEGEVGGHEEVRQVVIVYVASDGLVAARWAGVLQNGFVVLRVYPN